MSKHLRIMADAGLVSVLPKGRDRIYSLQPEQLSGAVDWIEEVQAQWDQRLTALVAYLDRTEGAETSSEEE